MRGSRKRKLKGHDVRQLNVVIRQELYAGLNDARGSLSLGAAVEKLIANELRRINKWKLKGVIEEVHAQQ
jgi:hypothetical protein